jgi:hypothetical protein
MDHQFEVYDACMHADGCRLLPGKSDQAGCGWGVMSLQNRLRSGYNQDLSML